MTLRRTQSIVSDEPRSDPVTDADVIMTAAALGLAADYIATARQPLQFDMDPLEAGRDRSKLATFEQTVAKMDVAVAAYLTRVGLAPAHVQAGLSPGYWQGAMIMGVYALAGQRPPSATDPGSVASPLVAPVLSEQGQRLWDAIQAVSPATPQYTGRGAYTGFVDNNNTVGNTAPVGPRSTIRMVAPATGADGSPSERWLPPEGHALWAVRQRRGTDTFVPWGLIGGNSARNEPGPANPTMAANQADQIEREMRDVYGMVFANEPSMTDIATYTHGMIQAIYKAYALGPSCVPFEIAVGDQTKKMASCLGCTLFMYATGYPPTSIHLGSAESWAPLYAPYNPNGPTEPHEHAVIRDLNNVWSERCGEWLSMGLDVMDDQHIAAGHLASRDAVREFLLARQGDPSVGGNLVLDALTVHDSEANRIARTLT
jgi:hypothetical protein